MPPANRDEEQPAPQEASSQRPTSGDLLDGNAVSDSAAVQGPSPAPAIPNAAVGTVTYPSAWAQRLKRLYPNEIERIDTFLNSQSVYSNQRFYVNFSHLHQAWSELKESENADENQTTENPTNSNHSSARLPDREDQRDPIESPPDSPPRISFLADDNLLWSDDDNDNFVVDSIEDPEELRRPNMPTRSRLDSGSSSGYDSELEPSPNPPIGEDIHLRSRSAGQAEGPPDVSALLAENKRLNDRFMCKTCSKKLATIVFLPCRHLVYCVQCFQHVLSDAKMSKISNMQCPQCDKVIEFRIVAKYE